MYNTKRARAIGQKVTAKKIAPMITINPIVASLPPEGEELLTCRRLMID